MEIIVHWSGRSGGRRLLGECASGTNAFFTVGYVAALLAADHAPPLPVARQLGVLSCRDTCQAATAFASLAPRVGGRMGEKDMCEKR
eukprot:7058316-Pyramimonas_sp.AAC.1